MGKDAGPTVVPLTEGDVARQAELVVMEYLKTTRCAKTLDAMLSLGSSSSAVSPMSSEIYTEDVKKKKKTGAKSVLDYMVSKMEGETRADTTQPPSSTSLDRTLPRSNSSISTSSSSRRRASTDDSGDDTASAVEWTREETHLLKKAIKQTADVDDKNERWKQIANIVGNGKSKKHCYLKYKQLKEERSSSRSPSNGDRPRSRRSSEGKSRELEAASSSTSSATRDSAVKPTKDVARPAQAVREAEDEPTYLVKRAPSSVPQQPAIKIAGESLEMEDCEDFDTAPVVPVSRSTLGKTSSTSSLASATVGRPPSTAEIESLRDILFPEDRKSFSSHWEEQGFPFSDARNLRYGLVQHQGGPCGVLAVVQAFVLRFLFETVRPSDWRNPTKRDQEQALVEALSHILWQAARGSRRGECVVVINDEKAPTSSSAKRKFMANMQVFTAKSADQTKALLTQHVRQFTAPRGNGLVLLVLSALLSKGVETIKPEMDSVEGALGGGGKLIGGHDYCTQEIVNLLLCGVASSNVFNGKQLLEGASEDDPKAVVLKGIPARCDVGFLSLFEAYEYIVVGNHLKVPRFNVWVVCSESHYSVLFAEPALLTSDAIHDKTPTLDVFYFDGLGNQDEEIRLTVHATALSHKPKPKPDDLVPPLNLVLQTKWPLARVDWNGVEPHL